jgi:hypothetical protein
MRNHWVRDWGWVVVSSVVIAGCGRSDARRTGGAASSEGQPARTDEVTLVGCIGTASGTRDLVLQNVRYAGSTESDARKGATERLIAQGSWVGLAGADPGELARYTGREVQVSGTLADLSGSTGTSGDENSRTPSTGPGTPTPSGDRSQAATDQHHSGKVASEAGPIARDFLPPGPAPELRVREIKETGASCRIAPR